jgi:hypothetical protein
MCKLEDWLMISSRDFQGATITTPLILAQNT